MTENGLLVVFLLLSVFFSAIREGTLVPVVLKSAFIVLTDAGVAGLPVVEDLMFASVCGITDSKCTCLDEDGTLTVVGVDSILILLVEKLV